MKEGKEEDSIMNVGADTNTYATKKYYCEVCRTTWKTGRTINGIHFIKKFKDMGRMFEDMERQ